MTRAQQTEPAGGAKALPPTVVAEVSRNWPIPTDGDERLLSDKFQHVINFNHDRGYDLKTWQLSRSVTSDDEGQCLNETIIAVFERVNNHAAPDPYALLREFVDAAAGPPELLKRASAALDAIEGRRS
jgi:hypothetical protein